MNEYEHFRTVIENTIWTLRGVGEWDIRWHREHTPERERTICYRCAAPRLVLVADSRTHNLYHDDKDAGRPSRFASNRDWSY